MADCSNKTAINFSALGSSSAVSKAYHQQENIHRFQEIGEVLEGSRKKKVQADVDVREVYFLIMHFLSESPCQRAYFQLKDELLEHRLLPRRYHAWYSRTGGSSGDKDDDGVSLTLSNSELLERFSFIEKDHLVNLLQELLRKSSTTDSEVYNADARAQSLTAADASTLLGLGSVSLIQYEQTKIKEHLSQRSFQSWRLHRRAGQVHALAFRELGCGFARHNRAPSVRASSYAIAKPSVLADRIQIIKTLRGHRNAVYCAIFDKTGEYIITGSDDRLVKIWSTTTGFCLRSCRGHDGDITDLAVSSNNKLVASASNDCIIRVWRFPDGAPVSVLRGHTSAVTAIAFSPRPGCEHHLLSSSDDGTCRIWDARDSLVNARIYCPKLETTQTGSKQSAAVQLNSQCRSQILCCGFNASGTIFATGSADKLARVWDACKWTEEPSGEPNHELDVLRGHEDDVNYVQFSGCAATARAITMDTTKEERLSKFRNSWPHESIVTCSRDGSAIIWIARPRKYHGKGRWIKSYHLRVPPPPMPPQPPRGAGPRQRLLPTPRGVNMIVWSLDNSFVLAAIMDCRICVWNAVDGSLVHSLTGHIKSTFVLDVHPYDPRIAMSAGYDGRVIIWDIWEGHPIKVYETGDFNLVDGKFSPDGTSIVISDEVGQIYLLATGQGESQKDAKYDQFFLGDYRPLSRDVHGYVMDQETQLCPHIRNLQDLLCDASMIPYPEPYQSLYQHRRLGTLGVNWRPPPVHMVVGAMADAMYIGQHNLVTGPGVRSPGQQGRVRWVEQPFETDDAMEWEQETGDDSGSDYLASIDASEEDEREESQIFSEDMIESSEEEEFSSDEHNQRVHLRRSERNKQKREAKVFTSSGRLVKRKFIDDGYDSPVTRSKQRKKPKHSRQGSSSRRESDNDLPRRPKRLAARNARLIFSQIGDSEDDDLSDRQKQQTPSSEHACCVNEQQQSTEDSGQKEVKEPDGNDGTDNLAMNPELSDVGECNLKTANLNFKIQASSKRGSELVEEMNDAVQKTASNGSGAGSASFLNKDGIEIGSGRRKMDGMYADGEDDDESSKDLTEFPHEVKTSLESKTEDAEPQVVNMAEDACNLTENTVNIVVVKLTNRKNIGCQMDEFESEINSPFGPFLQKEASCCEQKSKNNSIIGGGLFSLVEATHSPVFETLEHGHVPKGVVHVSQLSQNTIISESEAYTNTMTEDNSAHLATHIVDAPMKVIVAAGVGNGGPGEPGVILSIEGKEGQRGRFKEQEFSGDFDCEESAPLEVSNNLENCVVEAENNQLINMSDIQCSTESCMNICQIEGNKETANNGHLDQVEGITQEIGLETDNVYILKGLDKTVNGEGSYFSHNSQDFMEANAFGRTTTEEKKGAGNDYNLADEKASVEDKTSLSAEDATKAENMKFAVSSIKCKNIQEAGYRGKRTNLLRTSTRIYHRSSRYGPSGIMTVGKHKLMNAEQVQENGSTSRLVTRRDGNEGRSERMRITRNSKAITNMWLRQYKSEEGTSELMNSGQVNKNGEAEVIDARITDCNSAPELEAKDLRFSLRSHRNGTFKKYSSLENDEGNVLEALGGWKAKGGRSKRRVPWLLLTEVEEGARYIPQSGDEVAYVMQGHEEFLNSRHSEDKGPWKTIKVRLKAVEICRVTGVEYCFMQGFCSACCRISLKFIDEESKAYGRTFRLLLPELTNFSDFIIEKARYDTAIKRNWTKRDKCKVWWRSEDGKGGQWWYGRVVGVEAKSSRFPDSPWDKFTVQYTGDSSGLHRHSPWELFEPNNKEPESPYIDEHCKSQLLSSIEQVEEHCKNHEDEYGLRKLRQLVNKSEFLHKTPVPLSLETIKARLLNNYYRSFEAFKHDVSLLVLNVKNFAGDESELATKMHILANILLEK